MGKLVLIDGNAILHRAFHALPPLTNRRGEPINAVYGLVSMVLKVIQDLKPTHIAVAFDEKAPTFRHKEFAAYQAQRPPTHEDLSSQFAKAREFFKAARVPVYSLAGFEADDIIGTIASRSSEIPNDKLQMPNDVVIVTGDKDILQLVDDRVRLYMPITGLSNAKLFGRQETMEKMGVAPEQIPDYKALVGDPSDNYPGVSGIGPKTAISLLEKYGSLDKIYTHLRDIEPKIREKLEKGKKEVLLYHRLATIVKDVSIKFEPEISSGWDIDSEDVLKLFQEFGFKTLTERVKKVGKELDESKQMPLI